MDASRQVILFIGIPGCGKSTFFRERFFDTHVRINLDMLRTRHREMTLIQACLSSGASFVVDNTNVTKAERERYIPPAHAAGFEIIAYYFQAQLAEALQRNRQRTGAALIPEKGVIARYNQLQLPEYSEGFDRLYYVRIDPHSSQFIVEEWKA
jgi:predicted kinase